MILEICASNFGSVINAQKAGAHRIEVCSELAVGGITPSHGFIKKVIGFVSTPVFVLIRPRSGNFTYLPEEFEIMKSDIEFCKDLGCIGIVSGVLNDNNSINVERTKELIEIIRPMEFTFNRAFDWTPNPYDAMEQLIDLGVDRILTSGQESTAEKGIFVLKQMRKQANGRIKILPASGINSQNVAIFKEAGFEEIHCSATLKKHIFTPPKVTMNAVKFLDETVSYNSNLDLIQSILEQINDKA